MSRLFHQIFKKSLRFLPIWSLKYELEIYYTHLLESFGFWTLLLNRSSIIYIELSNFTNPNFFSTSIISYFTARFLGRVFLGKLGSAFASSSLAAWTSFFRFFSFFRFSNHFLISICISSYTKEASYPASLLLTFFGISDFK